MYMIVDGYREIKDIKSYINIFYMWHPPNYSSILSHWHDGIELIFMLEGTLNMVCGNLADSISPGDLVVVNPNQMHAAVSGKTDVKYYALCVDETLLSDFCANTIASRYILPVIQRKQRFQNLIHDENINQILSRLFGEYEQKRTAYELAMQADVLLLFALLSRDYIDDSDNPVVINTQFEQVIKYIDEHFTENISTESIAKKFTFNKSHFCRKFKSQTGMSFVPYLNQLRMDLAYSLLTTTNKSISSIAAECGYNDLNYFSRKFHEFYGMTASTFRQQSKLR